MVEHTILEGCLIHRSDILLDIAIHEVIVVFLLLLIVMILIDDDQAILVLDVR